LLWLNDGQLDRKYFQRDRNNQYLTIAWNVGADQQVIIDEVPHTFPAGSIVPLVIQQTFRFERPEDIVAWQFDRGFYCIVDNDKDVSCAGFLFYGTSATLFIQPGAEDHQAFLQLLDMFKEDMACNDDVQGTLLRALMVRLIIKITRLAKQQFLTAALQERNKVDIIRQFNIMVEDNFRKEHQVQFYAQALNKSPKTLSNLFLLYNHSSPLQVIHNRLILEAKRLFQYTDKSSKEIAADLGFEDATHFSRFFKNQTAISPSDFRKTLQAAV
jgi:AraC-like DNA-binding protein